MNLEDVKGIWKTLTDALRYQKGLAHKPQKSGDSLDDLLSCEDDAQVDRNEDGSYWTFATDLEFLKEGSASRE